MYNNVTCAAKGEHNGRRHSHLLNRSMQRAAVSIYKTEGAYEILVFAPGRIKENFHLNVKGNELTVSYTPPEGFPSVEWIHREYSRGGFVRTFALDASTDSLNITAKYVDGVLQVQVPMLESAQVPKQEIKVN